MPALWGYCALPRGDRNASTAGKLVKLRKVVFVLCALQNALDHK